MNWTTWVSGLPDWKKNADNVKITGNVRASYRDSSGGKMKGDNSGNSQSRLRTRLFLTGEVNDNWHYVSMLENNQYFRGENESGDSDTSFQRAYLNGNIGVWNITAKPVQQDHCRRQRVR